MLCKHVAATLLAMEYDPAVAVLRGLTDTDGPWRLEVISARGFGRKD